MKQQIDELKEVGRAYLNAASYCMYQARMTELNKKAIEAHNKKVFKEAQEALSIEELESEITRLIALRETMSK